MRTALASDGDPAPPREFPRQLLLVLAKERTKFLDFVRYRVRSGADAEDLLQQALLQAAEKLGTLRDPDCIEAWFYRILRRTIADHHAKWALQRKRLDLLKIDAEEGTPEEVATCACSLGLLEQLRPEYRDVLFRADVEEEPLNEIATSIGVTANNATVRLHRARKALREKLLRFCGTDSTQACLDCGCE